MFLTIENGFSNRPSDADPAIIERIIKSYNMAKNIQKNVAEEYQVSYMWLPIYERCMGEVMAALTSGDATKVAKIYSNFFRETCSIGLHGMPVDMASTYFSGEINEENKGHYTADLLHRFKLWISSIGKTCDFKELHTPAIGNPYGCYIDGDFYRSGVDYQHYYATIINRLIRNQHHQFILELGGGFGGLAHFLVRDNSNATYFDVDLPENMALTAYYLLSALPNKNIALFGEIDLKTADLSKFDAIILPNFAIEDIETNTVDLVFNSYSLSEMSGPTVANYISHFNRISSKFIYHINHTEVSKTNADLFNINFEKFELISRAPALWNLARNSKMDEFEFLYKAKNIAFTSQYGESTIHTRGNSENDHD